MQEGKVSGITIGVVCAREQDGLGRVKVQFPTDDNRESPWCRVSVPFGGTNDDGETYGYQWVPNFGDEVIVANYAADPKVPVILGTVFSQKNKPPTGHPDERVVKSGRGDVFMMSEKESEERILVQTAGKQKVELREKDTTIVIDNGHTITLEGDGNRIHIKSKGNQEVILDDERGETSINAPKVIVNAGSVELVRA